MYSVRELDGSAMTRSAISFNGHQNDSRTAEAGDEALPAARAPAGLALRAPWVRLSQGMAIRAAVEARLFGKRLLTLNADITVLPAERKASRHGRPAPRFDGERLRLEDAARSLESATRDLESAGKSQ